MSNETQFHESIVVQRMYSSKTQFYEFIVVQRMYSSKTQFYEFIGVKRMYSLPYTNTTTTETITFFSTNTFLYSFLSLKQSSEITSTDLIQFSGDTKKGIKLDFGRTIDKERSRTVSCNNNNSFVNGFY